MVKLAQETPAAGIRVEFLPTGGTPMEERLLSATTDLDGRFLLEGTAQAEGEVVGTLVLYPPEPLDPVRIQNVRFTTSRATGEVRYGGEWSIPFPYLPYEVSFYHRANGAPAAGIELEFQRTGGIPVHPDTFRITTNSFGAAKLRPQTEVIGEVTGDLLVVPLPPYQPYRISNIRMSTFTAARFDSTIVRAGLGPHLPYGGRLVYQGTDRAAEGVVLEFRRSGGVPIQPTTFTTTTDSYGTFHLNPIPLTEGELVGDLVVRSPAAIAGFVVAQLRLPTRYVDGVHFLGWFGVPRR